MPPSRRSARVTGRTARVTRRRVLQLGAAALAGSVAGCSVGLLEADESDSGGVTVDSSRATTTAESGETTHSLGVDHSLPEGSVEFPDGPKSRPERPDDLTAETAREYVRTFEYRFVYNVLHGGESTKVHAECGVDSVAEYGDGFRVVVWCSAWANTERNGTTIHGDYFKQYATYFVGSGSTVRREGRSKTRK